MEEFYIHQAHAYAADLYHYSNVYLFLQDRSLLVCFVLCSSQMIPIFECCKIFNLNVILDGYRDHRRELHVPHHMAW